MAGVEPDRIESRFDTVRLLYREEAEKLGPEFVKAKDLTAYMAAHLGTSETTSGRLLPAFAVVRDFIERSQVGEEVSLADFNKALEAGGHVQGEVWTRADQRDALVSAYLIDADAINTALDEAKRK